jgi:dihydrofolate reductase
MGKLIVTEFLTLDGVMEAPHTWSFPYWNDQISDFKHGELLAATALLLGRVTYEGFAEAWPSRTDETGFADRINSMPKFVASSTLQDAQWTNSTVIRGNLAEEVGRLKQTPEAVVYIHGSGRLINSLAAHDLIDRYDLLVYPIVLGKGQRLFLDGTNVGLSLAESRPMGSGVVLLSYEPARDA